MIIEEASNFEPLPVHSELLPEKSTAMVVDNDVDVAAGSMATGSSDTTSGRNPYQTEQDPFQALQEVTKTGRPCRSHRLPKRFRDIIPEPAPVLPSHNAGAGPEIGHVQRVILIVRDHLITTANSFGIWRDYPRRPTYDPDTTLSLEDLAVRPPSMPPINPMTQEDHSSAHPPYWPFANATIHRVMQWLNNGNNVKSESQLNEFVKTVIMSPNFLKDDLSGFDAHRENHRLDHALSKNSLQSQFVESTVEILVPSGEKKTPPKPFSIQGLLHRKLTSVISDAFTGSLAHLHHFSPFRLYHHSPLTNREERIYGEIYTSDTFQKEHEEIQRHGPCPPEDPGCTREKVVAALMFSSDATHLTDFGNAKAWPIYLMLGNLSKYIRSKPNSGAMHHLAYIPSVRLPADL